MLTERLEVNGTIIELPFVEQLCRSIERRATLPKASHHGGIGQVPKQMIEHGNQTRINTMLADSARGELVLCGPVCLRPSRDANFHK
jgi:hypothetical protein